MKSSLVIFFAFFLIVTVFSEVITKDKYAKHSLAKGNKPACMLTRARLGCSCDFCKDVVGFTKALILNHIPAEEEVLDKVCYRIFGEDKKKESFCQEIIKEELPDIIKYVRNHLEPKKACAKFC
ncbi:unnamed protein product [Caenorhabditis angaria]|uniref:Saposin B-type domain-containing protein n=1 Tax=Caenorhabditis angaria TaxID=860376 RepID=A0A9P1J3I6_9PELO|nr:unnamed protein product [Caenorhabditis angaria]